MSGQADSRNDVDGQVTGGSVVQAGAISGGVHHDQAQHAEAHGDAEIHQAGRDQYHFGGGLHLYAGNSPFQTTPASADEIREALRQIADEVLHTFRQQNVLTPVQLPGQSADTDVTLHVQGMLNGLDLGDHDEARRRVDRLFVPMLRAQQRAAVDALVRLARDTQDHTTQLVACSLVEAADRLDPTLIAVEIVESLARSEGPEGFSLRSSAAVLLWQWAEAIPGRVPIPLLARLTQPSTEDWYVHAPARAGARQLLLSREAARTVFDRMAISRDPDDRDYCVRDLLEVAKIESRAVPVDLAVTLARDHDKSVAARGQKLLRLVQAVDEQARRNYRHLFGL